MCQQSLLRLIVLSAQFMLASCAARFTLQSSTVLSEASALKALCARGNLEAVDVKTADSLYQLGEALSKAGKNEKAFPLLDKAIVNYRIALMKHAIAEKERKIAIEEQALAKSAEDVSAYQQVLKQLKTMEQK